MNTTTVNHLKLVFVKHQLALTMQVLEQDSRESSFAHKGYVVVSKHYPKLDSQTWSIWIRGSSHSLDNQVACVTFDSNQERDERLTQYLDLLRAYAASRQPRPNPDLPTELRIGAVIRIDNRDWEVMGWDNGTVFLRTGQTPMTNREITRTITEVKMALLDGGLIDPGYQHSQLLLNWPEQDSNITINDTLWDGNRVEVTIR